uniref:uncharacterized protein LOC122608184 n=1 Tax=Erigeron canadensis TaxID=72917 RepID=UPI001CB97603|nr:uncharacterized protein LOC122608184 [Erigeron canadensis]
MGSHLDFWEKDPFFSAAEEVQESADRMESTYRRLMNAGKEASVSNSEVLKRDLQTALGTTKWQLEEFEKAVESSYGKDSTEDAKDRHRDFISAMENQISRVESSWNDSGGSTRRPPRPWIRLDETERKELALFLSGSAARGDEQSANTRFNDEKRGRRKQRVVDKEDKFSGHRRAASASADIGSWNITVDDDNLSPRGKIKNPPRKVPSFSGLLNTLESASKFKWPKNGYKKLSQEDDARPLETRTLTRDIKESHERSKSCPEPSDDQYDKRLHGWYGAIQRLFQRSHYYMLYNRCAQVILWALVIIFLLALVVFQFI